MSSPSTSSHRLRLIVETKRTLEKDQLLCFASLPDTLDNEVRGRNFLTRLQPELSGNFLPDADCRLRHRLHQSSVEYYGSEKQAFNQS